MLIGSPVALAHGQAAPVETPTALTHTPIALAHGQGAPIETPTALSYASSMLAHGGRARRDADHAHPRVERGFRRAGRACTDAADAHKAPTTHVVRLDMRAEHVGAEPARGVARAPREIDSRGPPSAPMRWKHASLSVSVAA